VRDAPDEVNESPDAGSGPPHAGSTGPDAGGEIPEAGNEAPDPGRGAPDTAPGADPVLSVGLVTEVFPEDPEGEAVRARLREIRARGADLAVLPELPLDPWAPATKKSRPEDAEGPVGRRHRILSEAAEAVGIQLLGGAIVRDPESGRRHNTALLFDGAGELRARYRKLHIPHEEGFWEGAHYGGGPEPPRAVPIDASGGTARLGIQICSDINRPQGAAVLGAHGVDVIAVPRSTPAASYARWLLVLRAAAVTTPAFVISVNRPGPEAGVEIGGPSVAIGPDGEVLLETEDPVAVLELPLDAVARARQDYPGYLSRRARVYAEGWERAGARLEAG